MADVINTNNADVIDPKPVDMQPATVKQPGRIKKAFSRAGHAVKAAAPTFAKLATMGAAAGAAAGAVVHALGEHTQTVVEHIDGVKDAIAEKGGDIIESVKDSLEG